VPAALTGPETIRELTGPGGRLHESRRAVIDCCAASEHLDLVAPSGALYAFPRVVGDAAIGFDDQAFALELLETEDVLVVPGSGFNVPDSRHFRVTLLPDAALIREVFARIERALGRHAAQARSRHVA
jgi:alanine-synthesizing transaminase